MKRVVFLSIDPASSNALQGLGHALEPTLKDNTPVVLIFSGTRSQIEPIRSAINNRDPFVTEDGGAIFIPRGYFSFPTGAVPNGPGGYDVVAFGQERKKIRDVFVMMRSSLSVDIRGFWDMDATEVSELTGLSIDEAELARQTDFEEPFVFNGTGSDKLRLIQEIERQGLCWSIAGNIMRLRARHSVERAVMVLKNLFARKLGEVSAIGIGSRLEDQQFLSRVDKPVFLLSAEQTFAPMRVKELITVRAGDAGELKDALQ